MYESKHNDVINNIILKIENHDLTKPIDIQYESLYDSEIEAVCSYFSRQGFKIGYTKQEKVEDYKLYKKIKNVTFKLVR